MDVLAVIPKEQPDHASLTILVNQIASGLMNWQDDVTGQWRKNVVYQQGTDDDFDEEASDLIAASFLKAVRIGALKETEHKAFATKSYELVKSRIGSALLQAEYDAFQKALASAKPVPRKAPIRKTSSSKR
ncbi:MAG: hypothetical protein HUJ98_06600 [Bacteroidaceae bacterium]|nr:hypothetical protein [Bacteroidaceae bacterium]